MKIKYYGTSDEKGLNLSVSLFDREGIPVFQNFPMTETGTNTAIYKTENVFNTIPPINAGVYVSRVEDSNGNFLGYDEIIFNGARIITLLDLKFFTEKELMQLRDALGIDGDKMVARRGQLQKKSEYPDNTIIDTNEIKG